MIVIPHELVISLKINLYLNNGLLSILLEIKTCSLNLTLSCSHLHSLITMYRVLVSLLNSNLSALVAFIRLNAGVFLLQF